MNCAVQSVVQAQNCEFNASDVFDCVRIGYESCSKLPLLPPPMLVRSNEQSANKRKMMMQLLVMLLLFIFFFFFFIWLPFGNRFHRSLLHAHWQTNWNWCVFFCKFYREHVFWQNVLHSMMRAVKRDGLFVFIAAKIATIGILANVFFLSLRLCRIYIYIKVYGLNGVCVFINTHVCTHHLLVGRKRDLFDVLVKYLCRCATVHTSKTIPKKK